MFNPMSRSVARKYAKAAWAKMSMTGTGRAAFVSLSHGYIRCVMLTDTMLIFVNGRPSFQIAVPRGGW